MKFMKFELWWCVKKLFTHVWSQRKVNLSGVLLLKSILFLVSDENMGFGLLVLPGPFWRKTWVQFRVWSELFSSETIYNCSKITTVKRKNICKSFDYFVKQVFFLPEVVFSPSKFPFAGVYGNRAIDVHARFVSWAFSIQRLLSPALIDFFPFIEHIGGFDVLVGFLKEGSTALETLWRHNANLSGKYVHRWYPVSDPGYTYYISG